MEETKTPSTSVEDERLETLRELEDWLDGPVLVLGFVWLALLVVEFVWGLNPLLEAAVFLIWGLFVVDFLLRFALAPHKLIYLRKNWLTALSLLVPALRVFRIFRIARLARVAEVSGNLRLVKVVGSLNRGMRALRLSLKRNAVGYISLFTVLVVLVGAAGMFAFEGPGSTPGPSNPGFNTYGESVWWTAMMMTTMGSEFWPQTVEGRALAFLLALYAFAVFGYVTATLATFFIGREAESADSTVAGAAEIHALEKEVRALREEIVELTERLPKSGD